MPTNSQSYWKHNEGRVVRNLITPPSVVLATVVAGWIVLVTPDSLDTYGFGFGPSGTTAVVVLVVLLFSFAVTTVFASRVGLVAPLAFPLLSVTLLTVWPDDGGYRFIVIGFLTTFVVGVIECEWRGLLAEWITPLGTIAAGVHVFLALVIELLVRVPGSIGSFMLFVGVPCAVLIAGTVAAGAVTLAVDHDLYAPTLVLCGWLGVGIRDTIARIGEPRLTGFDVLAPFQLGPTPDYLFQLSGLAVLTVAVAAVEWDLRQIADDAARDPPADTHPPAGDSNDPD